MIRFSEEGSNFRYKESLFKSIVATNVPDARIRVNLQDTSSDPITLRVILTSPTMKASFPTILRTVHCSKVSDTVYQYLDFLGLKMEFEFIREGLNYVAYIDDRFYSLTLSKIFKANKEPIAELNGLYFVELTTRVKSYEEKAAEELNQLAENFAPVVELTKMKNI
jgi:hypothetical protein